MIPNSALKPNSNAIATAPTSITATATAAPPAMAQNSQSKIEGLSRALSVAAGAGARAWGRRGIRRSAPIPMCRMFQPTTSQHSDISACLGGLEHFWSQLPGP